MMRILWAFLLTLPWCEQVEAQSRFDRLSLATYNIRNYGAGELKSLQPTATNQLVLKQLMRSASADIFTIQEIVDAEAFQIFLGRNFPDYKFIISKCGGTGEQKLAILYNSAKFKLESFKEDHRIADGDSCVNGLRPALIAQFKINKSNEVLNVIAVHLKAGGRPQNVETRFKQLQIILDYVSELRERNQKYISIMGDFNTTEYIEDGQMAKKFNQILSDKNLVNFSDEIECTSYWRGPNNDEELRYASHLDHIIVSRELQAQFSRESVESLAHCKKKSCGQDTAQGLGLSYNEVSDHCPVVAKLF